MSNFCRFAVVIVATMALAFSAGPANADSSWTLKDAAGVSVAKGAFESYGEHVKVWDLDADGFSAGVQWCVGPVGSCEGWFYCWAVGDGAFNDCDRSYAEGTRIRWRICRGNSQTAVMDRCSDWLVDYA